jgi:hypothetical protein
LRGLPLECTTFAQLLQEEPEVTYSDRVEALAEKLNQVAGESTALIAELEASVRDRQQTVAAREQEREQPNARIEELKQPPNLGSFMCRTD